MKTNDDYKNLRNMGYMTSEEYVSCMSPALISYLDESWGFEGHKLRHPEDLATNASIFFDIAYRVTAELTLFWQSQSEN